MGCLSQHAGELPASAQVGFPGIVIGFVMSTLIVVPDRFTSNISPGSTLAR